MNNFDYVLAGLVAFFILCMGIIVYVTGEQYLHCIDKIKDKSAAEIRLVCK